MKEQANDNLVNVAESPGAKDFIINKYSFLAHLYFFFNSVFLPKGLLYTSILSPLFFYIQLEKKRKTWLLQFILVLAIFDMVHIYQGVDLRSFMLSNLLFITTYFSVIAIYYFINHCTYLDRLFRQLLYFNAAMVLVALVFFFFPAPYQQWFWYVNKLTAGIFNFPRLALLTYEASYYSLLFVPLFFYYFFKLFKSNETQYKLQTILLIAIPLLLSLSFGVIGAIFITLFIITLVLWNKVRLSSRLLLRVLAGLGLLCLALILLYIFFPANPLFIRLGNIFSGTDTSAKGRMVDSFNVAYDLAQGKNLWMGIGLGQVKWEIVEYVRLKYNFWGKFSRYDIPNSMGETLAIFGCLGVALRLGLEGYLFFKTRVYKNYYRLSLFIFIFIYQFTGSFITNTVEYVIWAMAFSGAFQQFAISTLKPGKTPVQSG